MPRALPLLGSMPDRPDTDFCDLEAIRRSSNRCIKSTVISETSADKCHYPSFSRFGP